METKKVFLAITAFWLAFSAGLSAEEQADTVKQFNALDYSLQKRYRPANETFISDRFIDNTFISAQGGIFNLAAWGDTKYAFGPSATLGMGKWINEYNALRISLSWKNFARKRDIAEFNLAGIGVNHLFNISSYLGGLQAQQILRTFHSRGTDVHMLDNGRGRKTCPRSQPRTEPEHATFQCC